MKQQQKIQIKLKNRFVFDQSQKQVSSSANQIITKETLKTVTSSQLTSLIQLYTRNTFENGFNPTLAFRVIVLYCYADNSNSQQIQRKIKHFSLQKQLTRFLTNHLNYKQLQTIQQCMDLLIIIQQVYNKLLIIEEVRKKLPVHKIKLYKIKVLSQLNKYYLFTKKPLQRKKSTHSLRQLCLQSLKMQQVKHNIDIYCEILDTMIDLQHRECFIKLKKRKRFQALQLVSNVIKYIENSQYVVKCIKYQYKLMQAYWNFAYLHYKLHYVGYTKKYCQIVINLTKRLQNCQQYLKAAQSLLEKVIV